MSLPTGSRLEEADMNTFIRNVNTVLSWGKLQSGI